MFAAMPNGTYLHRLTVASWRLTVRKSRFLWPSTVNCQLFK
jgi:hypothetical protein